MREVYTRPTSASDFFRHETNTFPCHEASKMSLIFVEKCFDMLKMYGQSLIQSNSFSPETSGNSPVSAQPNLRYEFR